MQVAGLITVILFYVVLAIGAINLTVYCLLDGDD
jgi:hypothetical protein